MLGFHDGTYTLISMDGEKNADAIQTVVAQ